MRRTLPRVRELKLGLGVYTLIVTGRTLPRVRELKRKIIRPMSVTGQVAPFPGCVN